MHTWESKYAWAITRVKVGAYLGDKPPCAIKREVSAQLRNNFEHVTEQNKVNHAWKLNQSIDQSVIKSPMLGPHQSPFI